MSNCDVTTADLLGSVKAKSDQLNGDDLIGGPLTGRVTRITRGSSPEQPVNIQLSCWHVPWRPCKTERRVLIALWGDDPTKWIGRTLRLQRDPMVTFGNQNVGGIRILGASDIAGEKSVMLNVSKAKKGRRTVTEIAPIGGAPDVQPVLLPAWAADGDDVVTDDQAAEIVALAAAQGVPVDALASKHGEPSTWTRSAVRAIVQRLQERATARRAKASDADPSAR